MVESKLFVVILVIAVIFTGIILQLILLDQKLRKLEKRTEDLMQHQTTHKTSNQ